MISGIVGYIVAGALVVLCSVVLVGRGGQVNKMALVVILAILVYGAFEILLPLLRLM